MGSASRAASCLCCPCRCLFSCLCSILISLLVALGVLVLVLYLVFRPHTISATVDSASLATFNLSSSSSSALLAYNLTVAMTVHNPNKHVGLYYDNVEALAFYQAQRFGYDQLDSFYQGTKASTQFNAEFHGTQLLQGDAVDAAEFSRQQATGNFAVNVGLNAKLRVKVWSFKVKGPNADIICKLLVPAPGATANGATFVPTDCKVSY